jgi:hypothetical protein
MTRPTKLDRENVRLFNPRRDEWSHHFCWGGDELVGLTAIGRATVSVLKLNRSPLEEIRKTLFDQGLHPPAPTYSPGEREKDRHP